MDAYEILKSLKEDGDSFSMVITKNVKKRKTMDELERAARENPIPESALVAMEEGMTLFRKSKMRGAEF